MKSLNLIPFVTAAALAAGACQNSRAVPTTPVGVDGSVPTMPMPMPGQATLAGTVIDSGGNPVAGATVHVAETDGSAVTDGAGAYSLTVPSDSTLTIKVTADNFASSYRASIMLAAQSTVAGFDITVMTPAEVAGANALGNVSNPDTRGLVALRLHSVAAGCTLAGAHIAVYPPSAATVIYSQPGAAGGIDQPNPNMDGVQDGTSIGAWLVDAIPPGNMLSISVTQSGCALMAGSPSVDGMMFTGGMRSDAKALTIADLFLDQTP